MTVDANGTIELYMGPEMNAPAFHSVFNVSETVWVHISVSCNADAARCVLACNNSYVGHAVWRPDYDWLTAGRVFIGELIV